MKQRESGGHRLVDQLRDQIEAVADWEKSVEARLEKLEGDKARRLDNDGFGTCYLDASKRGCCALGGIGCDQDHIAIKRANDRGARQPENLCPSCGSARRWPRSRYLNPQATAMVYCHDDWHEPDTQPEQPDEPMADMPETGPIGHSPGPLERVAAERDQARAERDEARTARDEVERYWDRKYAATRDMCAEYRAERDGLSERIEGLARQYDRWGSETVARNLRALLDGGDDE